MGGPPTGRVRDESTYGRATPPPVASVAAPSVPAVLDTAGLFAAGQTELRLRHRGEEYRLRITRQGKLILTK